MKAWTTESTILAEIFRDGDHGHANSDNYPRHDFNDGVGGECNQGYAQQTDEDTD